MIQRRIVTGLRRSVIPGAVLASTCLALVLGTTPAAAEPSTTVSYPVGASASRFTGLAFDTCTAPAQATMQAWTASPYDAVGIYIGGENRSCTQANLTASWVSAVSVMGWRLVPIYLGHQAPCTFRTRGTKFTADTATSLGTSEAADAVLQAKSLGLLAGSAIYNDLEHYDAADSNCRTAVLRYLSAWTKQLHRQGYLAGVYAHLYSGAKHLAEAYGSTSYARPDAVWIARWDLNSSLTGWTGIANSLWANGQRGKQYQGDHTETHGGVTLAIDSDRFDGPVATVGLGYRVTSSGTLNGRSSPNTAASIVSTYASGSTITVVCQTPGSAVGSTAVWDKLVNGTYVSDAYVSTASSTTYSKPLPRCSYPAQVTTTTLNRRTGPGSSYSSVGSLTSGSLAWLYCQRSGSTVSTSKVWDRLLDASYVSDYYVATASSTTYSKPIPRC